MAAMYVM